MVAAVFGWRMMVDSDPSGAAAAPAPPATPTSAGKAAEESPYPEPESQAEPGTDPSQPADPAHKPVRALYLGDSIALENHKILANLLEDSGT
ncbi:hypothetical protein ACFYW5_36990, partial [Streptomyces sp. NPDC002779]